MTGAKGKGIKDKNSAGGDGWMTPPELWNEACQKLFMGSNDTLDPCPNRVKLLPFTWSWEPGTDGLAVGWDCPTFVNPPFSDIGPWVKKAWQETQRWGSHVVMLLPVRSDQPWWFEFAPEAAIHFIRGRVNYVNPETCTTSLIIRDEATGEIKRDPVTNEPLTRPGGTSFPSCLIEFGTTPGIYSWWPEFHKARRGR